MIFLPTTCNINYVNIGDNYVIMQLMFTCNIYKDVDTLFINNYFFVNIIMLLVTIKSSHIIIFYLACRKAGGGGGESPPPPIFPN